MNVELIQNAAEHYKQAASAADAARLDFFCGLYELQQKRADELAEAATYNAPAPEDAEQWYWAGEPVLSHAPVALDRMQFAQTLQLVSQHLCDDAGLDEAAADALRSYDWGAFAQSCDRDLAASDPSAFIDACLQDLDSLGVGSEIPAAVFAMVPLFALRPHLQGAAEQVMALVDTVEGRRVHDNPLYCPVCGSPATASFVGQSAGTDGQGRMQYCGTCGTQWPFERIRCGSCGSFTTSSLHYFHLEGDAGHRLQSCDDCGQYQRVAFQEDLGMAPCMEIEDVVMAKLDKVALDPRFRK